METNQSDNFITWHIRQFMDDPAKTTALFYQHVADRKAAAEEVYACLRVLQLRRAAAIARSSLPWACVLAGSRWLSPSPDAPRRVVHLPSQCDPARVAHQDRRILAAAAEQLGHHSLAFWSAEPVRHCRGELGEALLRERSAQYRSAFCLFAYSRVRFHRAQLSSGNWGHWGGGLEGGGGGGRTRCAPDPGFSRLSTRLSRCDFKDSFRYHDRTLVSNF